MEALVPRVSESAALPSTAGAAGGAGGAAPMSPMRRQHGALCGNTRKVPRACTSWGGRPGRTPGPAESSGRGG